MISMPLRPGKLVCIGQNYVAHIKELGHEVPDEMVVFLKPGSAVSETLRAFHQEPLHYECELCLKIHAGQVSAIGLGLDITKRGLQTKLREKGLPWERCKAFDGSAVLSEFIEVDSLSSELRFELRVDGELRQQGRPELMLYQPEQIVKELKRFMTLEDGDVIMTGTPAGVGVIQSGQRFEASLFDGDVLLVLARWQAI